MTVEGVSGLGGVNPSAGRVMGPGLIEYASVQVSGGGGAGPRERWQWRTPPPGRGHGAAQADSDSGELRPGRGWRGAAGAGWCGRSRRAGSLRCGMPRESDQPDSECVRTAGFMALGEQSEGPEGGYLPDPPPPPPPDISMSSMMPASSKSLAAPWGSSPGGNLADSLGGGYPPDPPSPPPHPQSSAGLY
jgi:hypothetical protein